MSESLDTLRDLLTRTEFLTGLVCGFGALAVVMLAGWPRNAWAAGTWALATAAAVLVGVQILEGPRLGLTVGIALMAVGGALTAGRERLTSGVGWVIIASGACLIPVRGQVAQDAWFFVATPFAAVIVGFALAHWRTDEQRWLGPLFAISAFAVWTTVPDTELARLQLGVALPLALVTLRQAATRTSTAGAFALGGVFAWIPALGGADRPGSIIGAWATIGVIAALPASRLLWQARIVIGPWWLFAIHAVVVLIAARVIGMWEWAVPALGAAIVLYAVTIVVFFELDRSPRAPVQTSADR